MKSWGRERAAQERAKRLAHMDDQVAAGELVIRSMTTAERAAWDKREAALPAAERDRRGAALAKRRAHHARAERAPGEPS